MMNVQGQQDFARATLPVWRFLRLIAEKKLGEVAKTFSSKLMEARPKVDAPVGLGEY